VKPSNVQHRLYEYDTGNEYGPASLEAVEKFKAALAMGRPFFLYPYFGYYLKMTVREKEKEPEGLLPQAPTK
jgi:hypothetical protein